MFRLGRLRPSDAPYDVYPSSLFTLYLGYALWYPEPRETGEVQIGDVGYLHEGALIRLFNLNASKPEHHVSFWGDLEPFEPTVPLPHGVFNRIYQRTSLPADHYPSHGVQRSELSSSANVTAGPDATIGVTAGYTCKDTQGAVLVLNSPARSEGLFDSVSLRDYMRRHHGEWYDYARNVLDQNVSREGVVLVTGWSKTSADWKAVAFTRSTFGYYGSLEARAMSVAGAGVRGSRVVEIEPPMMHREGALYPRALAQSIGGGEPGTDQCAFLKRCKLKWRGVFRKIVGAAGYHYLPRDKDGGADAREGGVSAAQGEEDEEDLSSYFESKARVADPLEVLLDYILEVSDAEVALASDEDVQNLVGDETPLDFSTYLRHLQPSVEVDDSCGTISITDTVFRQRERDFARRFITSSDLYKWPSLTVEGAGSLKTGRIFVGPTEAESLPRKWMHVVFGDAFITSNRYRAFAISPDNKLVAASFSTKVALVWRLPDGLLVQRLERRGHTGIIVSIAFSPDSRTLVSGSYDETAIIWDVRTGRALQRLEGHDDRVRSVAWSPDGLLVATGSNDHSLKIWDASSQACLHSLGLGSRIYKIIFSADGSRLVVRSRRRDLIYDIRSGAPILLKEEPEHPNRNIKLNAIAISAQEDCVVAGSSEGAEIRSIVTGEQLLTLNEHADIVTSVAFSPDGTEVATASDDCTVVVCDSRTGQRRRVFQMSLGASHVAYSPDGNFIVMGERSGRIRVCDAKLGTFVADLDGHTAPVWQLQFLPDARTLLSRSDDGTFRMWNVRDVLRIR